MLYTCSFSVVSYIVPSCLMIALENSVALAKAGVDGVYKGSTPPPFQIFGEKNSINKTKYTEEKELHVCINFVCMYTFIACLTCHRVKFLHSIIISTYVK